MCWYMGEVPGRVARGRGNSTGEEMSSCFEGLMNRRPVHIFLIYLFILKSGGIQVRLDCSG